MSSSSTPKSVRTPLKRYTTVGTAEPGVQDQSGVFQWTDSVTKAGPLSNYRQVIARGGNATTSMNGIRRTIDFQPGLAYWDRTHPTNPASKLRYEVDGCYVTAAQQLANFPLAETTANNTALTRYYDRINGVNTAFKGMVFAGELRESLNLIKSPARALRRGLSKYLDDIKRYGPRVARARRLSFVRDTWLEYSLGFRPIVADIDNAIAAFYKSDSVKSIFEMVKGSGRHQVIREQAATVPTFGSLSWDRRVLRWEECFIQYYGIQHSYGNGVSNAHVYGFRPSEFLPTLWELIPYSFLVDYFFNIGNIVSSWSYRFIGNGWTAKLIRKTHHTEVSGSPRSFYTVDGSGNIYTGGGSPCRFVTETTSFTRTPSVSPGIPSLEFQIPGMGTKWVNILALSKQHSSASRAIRR